MSEQVDVTKQYANFKNVLKGAKQGEVVTRFPPEPSGYLHIGHVKAAILNYHYSKMYQGKMLLRFDDTNPSKENQDYVDSILADLKTLQVEWANLSYTSDHFQYLQDKMTDMIKEGKMYLDNTPVEQMRNERMNGIESKNRNNTPDENLVLWKKMINGDADDYCVRAKIRMDHNNKCMRDPVMYRCNRTPHHRTGTKHIAYPTYDYCCPLVDSLEGVTHALRTNEYSDRIEQYNWVANAAGVRLVTIYEFSRLNLQHTCLSKRKLTWFVDTQRVRGWDDPRFPTLRGVMRRGLRVQTLTEFMLEQGPSKNTNLMEWDKLWANNKKVIDSKSGRYSAISSAKVCTLVLTEGYSTDSADVVSIPVHAPNPALGEKPQFRGKAVYLEYDDAKDVKEGDKLTLMKWANCKVTKVEIQEDGSVKMEATLMEEDKDFKTTRKVNWLTKDSPLQKIQLLELDHLLKVKKVEEGMDFEQALNTQTEFYTEAYAEPALKSAKISDVVQFERRGFYIYDRDQEGVAVWVFIPDGKSKAMSSLSTKVDVANFSGNTKEAKKDKKEENEENGEKSKKQLKKEKAAAEKAAKREAHKKKEQEAKQAEKKKEDE